MTKTELTWMTTTDAARAATLTTKDENMGYPQGVFVIRSWTLETLATKINAVNRKLAKHGQGAVEPISFERKVHEVYRDETTEDGKAIQVLAAKLPYVQSLVFIAAARIQLSDRQSIAGIIERVGQSDDVIVTPYRTAGDDEAAIDRLTKAVGTEIRCDHCHSNRFRSGAWILTNPDGTLSMIARSCAKEYFGLNVASLLNDLIDIDNDDSWGSRAQQAIDRVECVAFTLAVLRKRGFVSQSGISELNAARKEANLPEIKSTVEIVGDYLDTQSVRRGETTEDRERRQQVRALVNTFRDEAAQVVEAIASTEPQDNFQRNVVALVRSMATAKDFYAHTSLLVAGVANYLRSTGVILPDVWEFKKVERAAQVAALAFTPGFVAAKGQFINLMTTVEGTRTYNNDFGGGYIVTLRTDAGQCIKYFGNVKVHKESGQHLANGTPILDTHCTLAELQVGQKLRVKATVKDCKSNTFRNVTTDETIVTRPTFILY